MPSPLRQLARRVVPVPVRVALTQWPDVLALLTLEKLPVDGAAHGHVVCARSTPLRRERTAYAEALQRAKEHNVARAAQLLDGLVLAPGALFSWHRHVGPPVRLRGFLPGPELHDDHLEAGDGGGLCQVANLLFWLALHAGFTIVERHRHALDLFPDDSRTVPFGCGATVFFPRKDLRFSNANAVPASLHLSVHGGALHGEVRTAAPLPFRVELVEQRHRFVRRDGVTWRENSLYRRWHEAGGVREEWVADHSARVGYEVEAWEG